MLDGGAALRGAVLLTAFGLTGFVVARAGVRRVDAFAVVWWALAVTSVAGVALARLDRFSLPALIAADVLVAVVAALVGRRRDRVVTDVDVWVSGAAAVAGLVAAAWIWPPFDTFLAAADSTMYVDAGIHLARTGSFTVPDTVARLLPRELATGLFPSVGVFGQGPFIRLPGGLLMESLDATRSTPAFFPLLPVWTAVLAAVGGPASVPAVAPIAMGLAVWAVVLFAGERFGIGAALATAGVLIANFAVWWFGRFPMSEPLTIAFVWGGMVFLGRREPFAAGLMLGFGGLARTETLVFAVAAVAWWATWTRVDRRAALTLVAGLLLGSLVAMAGLLAAPSHHFAYLANDVAFARTKLAMRMLPALRDGRLFSTLVLLAALPLALATVAAWRGRGALVANMLKATVAFMTIGGLTLYLQGGDRLETLRHLGWLATFMSPLAVALGVVGMGILWTRGGTSARLAVLLIALTAVVFLPNPRVAAYQPWAIRRFLPIVIPGLTIAAGAAIGNLTGSRRRSLQLAGVLAALAIVAQAASPALTARRYDYFAGTLAGARRVADAVPTDAVVVVDSSFADMQIQVPLWLVYGREAVMVTGARPAWRVLLKTLIDAGRSVYWIQNRLAAPPDVAGLVFTPVMAEHDLTIVLPDAPADAPPGLALRRLVPLRVYGVRAGEGRNPGGGVGEGTSSSGGGVGMFFKSSGSS